MAAKSKDTDLALLQNLVDHARKVLTEFLELPVPNRVRATELIGELEHVTTEFRRLRPAPSFRPNLTLIEGGASARFCGVCGRNIKSDEQDRIETVDAIYHLRCYYAATDDE
jgi:hypothetical protein